MITFSVSDIFLKTTSVRFQKEKLAIGECKEELTEAIVQFKLLLDGEGHRAHTVSNVYAYRDKTNLLRGLTEQFEIRYDSLKSCDHFLVLNPSTWPQEMQDLHGFRNNRLQHSQ